MKNYLNFEVDIKDLEKELDELKDPYNNTGLSEVETDKISMGMSTIDFDCWVFQVRPKGVRVDKIREQMATLYAPVVTLYIDAFPTAVLLLAKIVALAMEYAPRATLLSPVVTPYNALNPKAVLFDDTFVFMAPCPTAVLLFPLKSAAMAFAPIAIL